MLKRQNTISDCPQVLYVVCLTVPIIIRKDGYPSFLPTHGRRLTICSEKRKRKGQPGKPYTKDPKWDANVRILPLQPGE